MTEILDKDKLAELSKQRHECIEELKNLKREKMEIETTMTSLVAKAVNWMKIRNSKNDETQELKAARSANAGKTKKELLTEKLERMERDLMVGKVSSKKEKGFVNSMKELKREIDNLSNEDSNPRKAPTTRKQKEIHTLVVAAAKEASKAHKNFSETLDDIVFTTLTADGLVLRRKKLTSRFERLQASLNEMHQSVPKHMQSSTAKITIADYLDSDSDDDGDLMSLLQSGGTIRIGGGF